MATTANAVAANDAIVGYTGNNEALINLANQVVSLGSTAAANNAGNQLRADSHGPSSQLALQPAMDVLNVVTAHSDETNLAMLNSPSGVAAGENAAGWAPWSEVLGTTGHQSNDGQFAGYGLSTEGILFGADKELSSEVRIGGLGSYTHASLTDHGDLVGDGTGLDNYGLFGYGSYVGPRAYFDISAGVMLDRFNTTRVVNIGDFHGAAFGKHDGLQEIAKAEGGYPFALNSQRTTTFSPLWGLAVMHLHQSAYGETGGSAAALAVGSSETWSVKGEIGGKLEHSIKAAGATWVPELRVLWRHEFDRSATSQRESFLEDETGSTEFTTEGPRPEANTGLLEAGVTVLTHGDVSLAIRYQADVGSGYFDQGGRLRLRWDF
jgi:outer membrane autotransporter protein